MYSFFFFPLLLCLQFSHTLSPSPISQPLLSANRRSVQPINPTALFVPTTSSNSSSSYLSHLLLFSPLSLNPFPQSPPVPLSKCPTQTPPIWLPWLTPTSCFCLVRGKTISQCHPRRFLSSSRPCLATAATTMVPDLPNSPWESLHLQMFVRSREPVFLSLPPPPLPLPRLLLQQRSLSCSVQLLARRLPSYV